MDYAQFLSALGDAVKESEGASNTPSSSARADSTYEALTYDFPEVSLASLKSLKTEIENLFAENTLETAVSGLSARFPVTQRLIEGLLYIITTNTPKTESDGPSELAMIGSDILALFLVFQLKCLFALNSKTVKSALKSVLKENPHNFQETREMGDASPVENLKKWCGYVKYDNFVVPRGNEQVPSGRIVQWAAEIAGLAALHNTSFFKSDQVIKILIPTMIAILRDSLIQSDLRKPNYNYVEKIFTILLTPGLVKSQEEWAQVELLSIVRSLVGSKSGRDDDSLKFAVLKAIEARMKEVVGAWLGLCGGCERPSGAVIATCQVLEYYATHAALTNDETAQRLISLQIIQGYAPLFLAHFHRHAEFSAATKCEFLLICVIRSPLIRQFIAQITEIKEFVSSAEFGNAAPTSAIVWHAVLLKSPEPVVAKAGFFEVVERAAKQAAEKTATASQLGPPDNLAGFSDAKNHQSNVTLIHTVNQMWEAQREPLLHERYPVLWAASPALAAAVTSFDRKTNKQKLGRQD